MNWTKLHKKFAELKEITGCEKSSSYTLSIHFNADGEITVELGGYDIPEWNRHKILPEDGYFQTEEAAFEATETAINKAIEIVNIYKKEGYYRYW